MMSQWLEGGVLSYCISERAPEMLDIVILDGVVEKPAEAMHGFGLIVQEGLWNLTKTFDKSSSRQYLVVIIASLDAVSFGLHNLVQ